MKSFLLQQLARSILPLALLLGLALMLKGHDEPGGGFVSGLSFATAGILGFTAWGTRTFYRRIPVEPEVTAFLGGILVLASLLLPLLLGDAALTHYAEWRTSLIFELGVVMIVGGGLSAAALWLWQGGED